MELENKKHEKFCRELIKHNYNKTKAYLEVYPESSKEAARKNTSRLMANDGIKNRIAQLQQEQKQKDILSIEECKRLLSGIALEGERNSDRIRALEILLKSQGGFNEGNLNTNTINIVIDDISKNWGN